MSKQLTPLCEKQREGPKGNPVCHKHYDGGGPDGDGGSGDGDGGCCFCKQFLAPAPIVGCKAEPSICRVCQISGELCPSNRGVLI